MRRIRSWLKRRVTSKKGASMVEYGLLVALIAVVSILVIQAVGTDVATSFDTVQDNMDAPSSAAVGSLAGGG